MKKVIYTLAVIAALAVVTPARAIGLDWGLTGGLNLSKVHFSNASDNFSSSNRAGWFIGPKVKVSLVMGLGFDAAIVYSQKSYEYTDNYESDSETFRSLEIPINLRYSIGIGSLAAVYIATGPQFGIGFKDISWCNVKQDTDKFNCSWNVGAGVTMLSHLEVGIGYNFALSKYKSTSENYKWRGNTFQVQVAYFF